MYKLIAIDLDGTMLNSYGKVTENTKQAIKEKIESGVEVIIASGRPMDSIKSIAEEIGSNNYFIAGNGALIYDIKEDKPIYERYLDKKKVLEIVQLCKKNSIAYNVYTNEGILATSLKYNVLYYYKENIKKEESKKTKIIIVNDIEEHIQNNLDEKYIKITVCDENQMIFNSIIRKLRKIKGIEVLDVLHTSKKIIKVGTEEFLIEYNYTEISRENVDKWFALEELMKKLGISKEELVTIGDNINDKMMTQNSGMGVIMQGSSPAVIEIADYITEDNDNEGVANILRKIQ